MALTLVEASKLVSGEVVRSAVIEMFARNSDILRVLPLSDLETIARNAGLEWVNSDADKIRAAQEAIANEPKPVHVPRERKPPVQLDEGPLVLVETRKDLKDIALPFEESASA